MSSAAVMAVFDTVGARAHADGSLVRTLAVTSTVRGEGTSAIALGTALSFAAFDSKAPVLLIDANWLHPSLSARAGREAARGLAECLGEGFSIDRAISATERPGLSFLAAGQAGERVPPLGRIAEILAQAHAKYAKVIIDLPPVMVAPSLVVPWADAADATYLVVRGGATPVSLSKKAMGEIAGQRPAQIVLNRSRDRSDVWARLG